MSSLGPKHYQFVRESTPQKTVNDLTYEDIKEAMSTKFTKQRSIIYERFHFSSIQRKTTEYMREFATKLREASAHCEFGVTCDQRIRDQFIFGIKEQTVQQELIKSFSNNNSTAD